MRFIAHRGLTHGVFCSENKTYYKQNEASAVSFLLNRTGFEVEVDVWKVGDKWYLGHDEALTLVTSTFLDNQRLWCHAKNKEALLSLKDYACQSFWHDSDDYVLTSGGEIWTSYDEWKDVEGCNIVLDEKLDFIPKGIVGICSYNIDHYMKLWKNEK